LHGNHGISASEFAAKWKGSTRTERAASQEHFIDLCRMLGVETPNEADPTGEWYAFEKGAEKVGGGDGFADVWKKAHFAWEYKGKRKNLDAAYQQLLQYREALENPPLLVVCDLYRFEIHTNFTGTKKIIHAFTLDDLRDNPAEPLRVLNAVMKHPEQLRPEQTRAEVTEWAAGQFAKLAGRLHDRGNDPHAVAHFLNKLLFCLFAEDVDLLPRGLFERLVQQMRDKPQQFSEQLKALFERMANAPGGFFGADHIEWFNGGLFSDTDVLPLDRDELNLILLVAKLDWSNVEPAILGTLFERGLDPKKRSQLGAHYTDKESILRVVEPVVMQPLRREFEAMKQAVLKALAKVKHGNLATKEKEASTKARNAAIVLHRAFLDRLRKLTVLDPACGSGNFLYVTLQLVKDLEKEAILWGGETLKTTHEFPGVGPQIVHGIELNDYAAELARVTIWIGQIQWMIANGFSNPTNPVLQPLKSVEERDAILDLSDPSHPRPATWPPAEFVVGNPPFLGGKKMRSELGDEYVDALFKAWDGVVPREADFVVYWHEKARQQIERHLAKRAGLLATQSIRAGASRTVLERIKDKGQIFTAWSDEPWVVEGAAVRVSIVAQDDGRETARFLDGKPVDRINADLTPGGSGKSDVTEAKRLLENLGISFMGDTKGGSFDITREQARKLVLSAGNPHGKPNIDVVKPWINGFDVTRRSRDMFIIDFGTMIENEAALYEAPFEFTMRTVKPEREASKTTKKEWWHHERPRPDLFKTLTGLDSYIVTPRVAKHRLFMWSKKPTLPDSRLYVFALDRPWVFGVLHSRVHEKWSLAKCSWHGVGNDPTYNNTDCFETFPFPWPLNTPEPKLTEKQHVHHRAISDAAKWLHEKRERWLNPPELVHEVPDPPLPACIEAVNADAAKELKRRTLTNLYNERPSWLAHLHEQLDHAVLDAYGLPHDISDDALLAALLKLNLSREPAK
jgi:type II restriction/modification system DNA methylase subunit YeeA